MVSFSDNHAEHYHFFGGSFRFKEYSEKMGQSIPVTSQEPMPGDLAELAITCLSQKGLLEDFMLSASKDLEEVRPKMQNFLETIHYYCSGCQD